VTDLTFSVSPFPCILSPLSSPNKPKLLNRIPEISTYTPGMPYLSASSCHNGRTVSCRYDHVHFSHNNWKLEDPRNALPLTTKTTSAYAQLTILPAYQVGDFMEISSAFVRGFLKDIDKT